MIYLPLIFGSMLISITGFGGGPAMLANIHAVFVETGMITEEAFNTFLTIAFSLPGGISIKMVSLIGYEYLGLTGFFIALLAYLVPSTSIMLASDKVSNKFGKQLEVLGKFFPLLISAILINLMFDMSIENITSESIASVILILLVIDVILYYGLNKRNVLFLIISNITIFLMITTIF